MNITTSLTLTPENNGENIGASDISACFLRRHRGFGNLSRGAFSNLPPKSDENVIISEVLYS